MSKRKEIKNDQSKKISQIIISLNNRITYVFKQDLTGRITKIVNVSFDIVYINKWVSIVRYDNYHGFMHRHKLITFDEVTEIVDKVGVKQKGSVKKLLSWAINDIKNNYYFYKKKIISRTNRKLSQKVNIEFY